MRHVNGVCRLLVIGVLILGSGVLAAAAGPDVARLAQDNCAFALDLYGKSSASQEGNLFLSPYSISASLAMTYAGARGNTEKEMAEALHFSLEQPRLHPAFADLQVLLDVVKKAGNVQLDIANSLWPQDKYGLLDEYLALTKEQYGVSIQPVDFAAKTEKARATINRWVEEKTHEKIKELIQPGVLDDETRLVLTNAVYFRAAWQSPFNARMTEKAGRFYVANGRSVEVPMMFQAERFGYADLGSSELLELPYARGPLSMIVLLPKEVDGLKKIESSLTRENVSMWRVLLERREVLVHLPKFKIASTVRLDKTLQSLGMADAFTESRADFSGMDGKQGWLYLSAVLHKTFVEVTEEGTEAAAATAVVVEKSAPERPKTPPPTFRADHPFLFLIQENTTGSILFIGRVADPTKPE